MTKTKRITNVGELYFCVDARSKTIWYALIVGHRGAHEHGHTALGYRICEVIAWGNKEGAGPIKSSQGGCFSKLHFEEGSFDPGNAPKDIDVSKFSSLFDIPYRWFLVNSPGPEAQEE